MTHNNLKSKEKKFILLTLLVVHIIFMSSVFRTLNSPEIYEKEPDYIGHNVAEFFQNVNNSVTMQFEITGFMVEETLPFNEVARHEKPDSTGNLRFNDN